MEILPSGKVLNTKRTLTSRAEPARYSHAELTWPAFPDSCERTLSAARMDPSGLARSDVLAVKRVGRSLLHDGRCASEQRIARCHSPRIRALTVRNSPLRNREGGASLA